MRLTLLLCTCASALNLLYGQELERSVIGSTGAYHASPTAGNLHYTLGEVATFERRRQVVLQAGFYQGNTVLELTSIWIAPTVNLHLEAYPNPTTNRVVLNGSWERDDRYTLTDMQGRRLRNEPLPLNGQAELKLANLPAGTYFLTITRAGRPLQSLRLVRQ